MANSEKLVFLDKLDLKEVMQFINDHATAHQGNAPTFRLLGKRFGITSTSQMSRLVKRLEKEGLVRRDPELGKQAPIEVIGSRWMAPTDVTRLDELFKKIWDETPRPTALYFMGTDEEIEAFIAKFRLRSTEKAGVGSFG